MFIGTFFVIIETAKFQVFLKHVYVESNGRRPRARDSLEPDWLLSYKKKQKERRESQEKSDTVAIQQSIEGAAYGRPIVPKFTGGGTYTVTLPSGSSAGEQGKVAWVAITSSTSPAWKTMTPTRPVEHALPTGNVPSARSSPAVRYGYTQFTSCLHIIISFL